MGLTVDHKDTVHARVRRDPEFRRHLLDGGVEHLLAGEVGVAKILLSYCISPTIGFEELGARTGRPPESLVQMFGPEGDPSAGDVFEVIACLLRHEGLALQVRTVREERDDEDRAVVESVAAR